MKISFTVVCPPVPKARPRMGRHGNVYTPKQTVAYEKMIAGKAWEAMATAGWRNTTQLECEMWLRIYYPNDKVMDDDNVLKSALDAMNNVVYADDRLVRRCLVVSEIDPRYPRIEVMVREAKRNRRGEKQTIK